MELQTPSLAVTRNRQTGRTKGNIRLSEEIAIKSNASSILF